MSNQQIIIIISSIQSFSSPFFSLCEII